MSQIQLRHHTFIGEWEPLHIGKEPVIPHAFEHEDGRRRLYFLREGEMINKNGLGRDITRIGYRVWEDGTMLLGMCAAQNLRGKDIGIDMVNYFMEHAPIYEKGLSETAIIHKPLIALTLTRCGFQPESTEVMAEILPRSHYDNTGTPKIGLSGNHHNVDMTCQSSGNSFYELIPDTEIIKNYPINNPDMTVALHTPYYPPVVTS